MNDYLQLIRWKNLLFLVLIQGLMIKAVALPLLQTFGFDTSANSPIYLFLLMATLLITAGGYVINDYFDVKIDKLNRPDEIIVGEKISRQAVIIFYLAITVLGELFGLLTAILSRSYTLGFIFLLIPGILWFYSASYKRQFLIGNLIVSLCSALAVFIVAIAVVAQLRLQYGDLLVQTPVPKTIYGWSGGFALFAFLLTWIREIIKDLEDINGDRELECRTMPIKWGINKTKLFLYALILSVIAALFHVNYHYIPFDNSITTQYIIFGLTLPLLALGVTIFKAQTPIHYHYASTLSKYIMLTGILYSLIFYFLLAQQFGIRFFNLFVVK